MADKQKISINDNDAEFLSLLPNSMEYIYYGSYSPNYLDSTTVAGLNLGDTSPLSQLSKSVGFTLENDCISALTIDATDLDPIEILRICNNLPLLSKLKEFLLILNSDLILQEIEFPSKLQYLEIRTSNRRITLPSLENLSKLSVLIVEGIVKIIPDLRYNLNLQRLVIKKSQQEDFPEEICKLDRMVWLEIGNHFNSIPDSIINLEKLVILELISDQLEKLPANFGSFDKLQHLSMEFPKIKKLPSTFPHLSKLSDLYLWNLPFDTLPVEVLELSQLQYLWVKDNKNFQGNLQHIPTEIGNLIGLKDLQLNGQQIRKLPESIGSLENLESLKLGSNKLKQLPTTITELSKLRRLELYYNPLEKLPVDIGNLLNLQHLDISDTGILEIPVSFGQLSNLVTFDAIGCNLVGLPDTIINLNPEQFLQFHISLRLPIKDLDDPIHSWFAKLEEFAETNENRSVEVQLYQQENQENQENVDNEGILLEETEIDQLIADFDRFNKILKGSLQSMLFENPSHPSLLDILEDLPLTQMNELPTGMEHSIYDLLYHINMSILDILIIIDNANNSKVQDLKDYWNDDISSSLPKEEVIDELVLQIKASYSKIDEILSSNVSLFQSLPSNSDQTILEEILKIITHTSYHLGQLVQLKSVIMSVNDQ